MFQILFSAFKICKLFEMRSRLKCNVVPTYASTLKCTATANFTETVPDQELNYHGKIVPGCLLI